MPKTTDHRVTRGTLQAQIILAERQWVEPRFESEGSTFINAWQALRKFAGLPPLTTRDILADRLAMAELSCSAAQAGDKTEARKAVIAAMTALVDFDSLAEYVQGKSDDDDDR